MYTSGLDGGTAALNFQVCSHRQRYQFATLCVAWYSSLSMCASHCFLFVAPFHSQIRKRAATCKIWSRIRIWRLYDFI